MNVGTLLVFYILAGLLFLFLFDLLTGRVRKKLRPASWESQEVLTRAGAPIGQRMALVVTIVAMVVFWPMVGIGAFIDLFKKGDNGTEG